MSGSSSGSNTRRELLEPRLTAEQCRQKAVLDLVNGGRPRIQAVARSGLLDSVRDFLPRMAEAEEKLNATMEKVGGKDMVNVENVEGKDEVIEMDLALVQDHLSPPLSPQWTSDSEADSTPSPSENSYTSDTDVSSSSICSTSSEESAPVRTRSPREASPDTGQQEQSTKKRPLIQELNTSPGSPAKAARQS